MSLILHIASKVESYNKTENIETNKTKSKVTTTNLLTPFLCYSGLQSNWHEHPCPLVQCSSVSSNVCSHCFRWHKYINDDKHTQNLNMHNFKQCTLLITLALFQFYRKPSSLWWILCCLEVETLTMILHLHDYPCCSQWERSAEHYRWCWCCSCTRCAESPHWPARPLSGIHCKQTPGKGSATHSALLHPTVLQDIKTLVYKQCHLKHCTVNDTSQQLGVFQPSVQEYPVGEIQTKLKDKFEHISLGEIQTKLKDKFNHISLSDIKKKIENRDCLFIALPTAQVDLRAYTKHTHFINIKP